MTVATQIFNSPSGKAGDERAQRAMRRSTPSLPAGAVKDIALLCVCFSSFCILHFAFRICSLSLCIQHSDFCIGSIWLL
jgi:hypothetical protein